MLWNPQSRTFGAPDLLVRSDVLARLFPSDLTAADAEHAAPDLAQGKTHYRVVDIKFTTLDLTKDGHSGSSHFKYMVQLWLYNQALGRLQGYIPSAAFLLGRRWETSKERGRSALERLARIDSEAYFKSSKSYLSEHATAACAWIRKMRVEGSKWSVLPYPSVPELWPNIKRTDDQPWHETKLKIAHELEDLTLLPRVSPDKRQAAITNGLVRWTDAACNAHAAYICSDMSRGENFVRCS